MLRATGSLVPILLCSLPFSALAQEANTGATGSNQSFSNLQPSLGLNYFVPLQGLYPSLDDPGPGELTLGNVRMFAGNFTPGGSAPADRILLPIAQNTALFSLLGTTYGGDGETTFGVPDLDGRAVVHRGPGWGLGQPRGVDPVTLTPAQIPAHDHGLPGGLTRTGSTGGGQAFDNVQPSLATNYVVALDGIVPGPGSDPGGQTFVGQVGLFAGNFAPGGWAFAEGQLLMVSQFPTLFSILGTTYGGDGETTFALPDLRGRIAVGADGGDWQLGTMAGSDTVTLTVPQMPQHHHTLPSSSDTTADTGGNQPFVNTQPSLALNYIIATQGLFPSPDGGTGGGTLLGEVTLFAGNASLIPDGWILADGRELSINQNQALFSLLGTIYGGDGENTFALPNLRGRTAVHAGDGPWDLGDIAGIEDFTLTAAHLPGHVHTAPVPLPGSLPLLTGALALLAAGRRRFSLHGVSTAPRSHAD